MKTSIFDMNFTLPPLVEMHEVEKEMMPMNFSLIAIYVCPGLDCQENT